MTRAFKQVIVIHAFAVRNGFKPEQMLKATENMLKGMGEKNPDEIMEIVFDSWKTIVDKSEPHGLYVRTAIKAFKYISKSVEVESAQNNISIAQDGYACVLRSSVHARPARRAYKIYPLFLDSRDSIRFSGIISNALYSEEEKQVIST